MKEISKDVAEQVAGAKIKLPPCGKPPITTLALGEEGGMTTMALGEEGPVYTTLAVGEEGGGTGTAAAGSTSAFGRY